MNRKGSCPVLSGGKSSDNIKGLPIAIHFGGQRQNVRPCCAGNDGLVKEAKMKRFYVFKDGTQQGSMPTKEEAIELIRQKQKHETHPILRSEFSIIEGEEVFIPYPSQRKPPRKKSGMER